MSLADYHATAGDWRLQLRKNERKTRLVILSFILIYMGIGLLIDVVVLLNFNPKLTIQQCIIALVTLKAPPYATAIMAVIAVVALLITYAMYDKIMLMGTEYYEITPQTARTLQEKQLYNVVEEMKVAAGLQFMPKVYIIDADYMNAFASGYSEKSAMVAITRGLMDKLNRSEIQAVMAHELSHIRHHDIKLTLMVAVLSNIMLIALDLLFYSVIIGRGNQRENNNSGPLVMVIMILRYVVPLVTVLLTLFLSRTREYMADAGSVELMRDNEPMARALLKISQDSEQHSEQYSDEYGRTPHEQLRQASYLFDPSAIDPVKSLQNAFSTHPAVEDRLEAIGFKSKKSR